MINCTLKMEYTNNTLNLILCSFISIPFNPQLVQSSYDSNKTYSQTCVMQPYKTRYSFGFFRQVVAYCCMKAVQNAGPFCATFIQQ